ncbi:MAG: S46 family peptidase [Alistipes senegalensis]|nr:S46 family peptidase [Alistipes senegalensis]
MRKIVLCLVAAAAVLSARADEGMWLLPYLQKMNIRQMKQRGCKLSADEIYSLDRSSLKDAVVIFGGGCTGEIVSPEGLLFTNHHCGYGSIQQLSSVEHDYLKHGFWAMSNAEELPVPGLKVRFVRKIADATADILGNIPSIAGQEEYEKAVAANSKALTEQLREANPGMEVAVLPFFEGNQYFAFVYEVFTDIRLVGTPPSSIGKFGGDTDNWMWPRHTGDFSIFRVYAGPDNKPADYSPENRPYRADKFLKISLGGVNEGDFAMVMGFPGSTQRFATSYELDYLLDVQNPRRIFIRGERQKLLMEDMQASDAVRIQYASKYAGSSNYWKNAIGMSRGLKKLGVVERKRQQEESFRQWAGLNTLPQEGYIDALPKIETAMQRVAAPAGDLMYVSEAFLQAVELMRPVTALMDKLEPKQEADSARIAAWLGNWYKNYNPPTDRKVAKRMLQIAREGMHDLPSFYAEIVDKDFNGDSDAYVDYLYDNSQFTSPERLAALLADYSPAKVAADPAYPFAKSVLELYDRLRTARTEGFAGYAEGRRKYVAGLMLQQPDKAWASDANFTIRLTYGRVLPYSPADGIRYNHYTTLKGVIEKEDPKNPMEFTVPAKLKELYAARDFGHYANAQGELPVGFLADLDITGGNSGSPVLNARGELIGLAFDGNWEAMSGDVAFEPQLQRCIAVDARYVLFIIDKFAGARWLLDELQIVK